MLSHRLAPWRLVSHVWRHHALGLAAADGPRAIESHLSEALGQPIRIVVRPPARRSHAESALEAYGPAGLAGIVKIGGTEQAREAVRHESEVLRMLADRPLKTVVPPTVLHHGASGDLDVLLLSPLPVPSRFSVRSRVPADLLEAAVAEIATLGSDDGCAWHGDFTPWNVAAAADGRLLVWNWERFATGVPYGFDALHYFFHRCLRRMRPREAAAACLARSGRIIGTSTADARGVAAHYLITLADRHRRDGHEPLGPPSEWLNPVVDHLESLL
ncbi:hypothetical protein [Sphaerimonospora thailandensis]|uniref:Phosphotransferase family enzyme n=1 Tax=Sphaerimonospora thailandensis TaxID=795644 RepID=A0A8J3RDJ4_9ACTN|nr:hypothetical protein [Sphaerimonospora thailandensis]GIH71877.1 hypothetical protein Mth01_41300 [Sphaerimonospora thailandensis]